MAGHSKWANIQHRKGAQDRKRGKLFSKLIREVTVAARVGGADPASNPRLRLAVDKARAQNMPKDTIERAIGRGAGGPDGVTFDEVTYEGYGPGGAALLITCVTDNRNRTVAEVRQALTRHGGNLGAGGSVAYLFNQVGLLSYPPGTGEETLIDAAIESGAEDVLANPDGSVEVLTDPADFEAVKAALEAKGLAPELAQVTMRSAVVAPLDEAAAERMLALQEALEDLDDVQNVYSNAEIPDEVLARL
jgi:YebC/PmpR family DNA-binding regulatory protein